MGIWCDNAFERSPQGLQTAALLDIGDELRCVTKAVRTITVKAKYEKEKKKCIYHHNIQCLSISIKVF